MLKQLQDDYGQSVKIHLMYDIACILEAHLKVCKLQFASSQVILLRLVKNLI